MILVDTHVLVWLTEDDARLGRRTRRTIEGAAHGEVAVSAITFWEIALLIEAKRLRSKKSAEAFRLEALRAGVREIAVDGKIAILAARSAMYGDPGDRMIVATALELGATLVTADARILAMKTGPKRLDAQS